MLTKLPTIYAGIGSRKTPDSVLKDMFAAAKGLASMGCILRSGGAAGADTSFERGCDAAQGRKEIFLPYKGFRGNPSKLHGTCIDARRIAKQFHPNWEVLGENARDFMGRNSYQILGADLCLPCDFILCWTKNGRIEGGTGQALRIAAHFKIPVFNFGAKTKDEINDAILKLIEEKEHVTAA